MTANTANTANLKNIGWRPMRRKRQLLPAAKAVQLLKNATSGVLALAGDNGWPYAVPLNHAYENGCLYFHAALQGQKIDAIRCCDKACFTVIVQDILVPEKYTSLYKSVMCFGRIHILENEEERLHALRLIGERCNPGDAAGFAAEMRRNDRRTLALCLKIEHISGKEGIELTRKRCHDPDLSAYDE